MTTAYIKSKDRNMRESGGHRRHREDYESDDPAISVQNLSKQYGEGDGAVTALSDVSFDVEEGSVVGILGPNGAGKTTLIKSVLNLVTPTSGSVEIFGTDVAANRSEIYNRMGAMFEGARNVYWRLTVRQNLNFFARLEGDNPDRRAERFDMLLESLDLKQKANEKVRNLSRGQKQKVAIATILSKNKDLVFLDEPTLGLDVESSLELRRELDRLVDDQGMTVVLTSHDMDVIEDLCDRVIIIEDGTVITDDSIDTLFDLFETDLYEIVVSSHRRAAVERILGDRYEIVSIKEHDGGGTECKIALEDPNEIPEFTGELVDSGIQLERVSHVERDFEDIFLAVTDTGAESPRFEVDSSRARRAPGVASDNA